MKRCPECGREYDDSMSFCLDDGADLLYGPGTGGGRTEVFGSVAADEPRTAILHEAETPSEAATRQQIHATKPTDTFVQAQEKSRLSQVIGRHKFVTGLLIVSGLAGLLGLGYGLYKFLPVSRVPARTNGSLTTQRLTGDGRTRGAVISPDGKFLVYLKLGEGKESLWIKQIATGSNVNVVKPGEANEIGDITFSPDGNFVYFNAIMTGSEGPTVYRVATLGGTPSKFLSDAQGVRFSKDGKFISYRRINMGNVTERIFIANADGSNEREVVSRTGKQFFTTPAVWSPDGKLLAVGIGDDAIGATGSIGVGLISVADGSNREFGSKRWDGVNELVWHPSGDSLIVIAAENAFLAGQLWELSYPSGEYRKLTNTLNGYNALSITDDGNSIVTGELYAKSAVWVSPDLKPENAKQIMPSTGDTWGLSWTPDGRIVYVSDQSGDPEVWIMDADGANARQLTNDRLFKAVPYASADGRYIVYMSSQNNGQIVRVNTDGSNPLALTRAIGADNPHVSPDGKWVVYSAYLGGPMKVMRVSIDGGEEQILTDYFTMEPRYSSDGSRIACFLMDEKTLQWDILAIVPAEGGKPIQNFRVPIGTNANRGPVWTPDEKGITVVVSSGEKWNLWLQPVDGSPGKPMTDFDVPGIARRAYSHDGKRIAIVRAEGFGNAIMITGFR